YQLYPQIAEWRAVVNRLTGFEAAMARSHPVPGSEHIERLAGPDGISLQGLDLNLPDGQPLLHRVAKPRGGGDGAAAPVPGGAGGVGGGLGGVLGGGGGGEFRGGGGGGCCSCLRSPICPSARCARW